MRLLGTLLLIVLFAACSGGDDDDETAQDVDETTAPTTVAVEAASEPLRVIALNQLHGLFCPEETDFCGAPARLELLFAAIEEADCPEVVGLAEIGPRQSVLVPERLPTLCDGAYTLLYDPVAQAEPVDNEMILTSLEPVDDGYVELSNLPWSGHWAQFDTTIGTVDFVMLHQASSSNNPPCTPEVCAPICVEGEETGTCHTREVLAFLDEHGSRDGIQLVTGDLNKSIDDPRLAPYLDAGFEDAWALAGNAECDPATGAGCTCCINSEIEDYDGGGLRDPASSRDGRIDFVLVRNRSDCEIEAEAEVFVGELAAQPVDGWLWPSDHAGVYAELRCA